MIRALSIGVVLLFLQPQISNTAVWMLYEMNKAAITEAFCVNKEKPALKCNGKCHLATQLTQPLPTESNQPTQASYIPQIDLFFLPTEPNVDLEPKNKVFAFGKISSYSLLLVTKVDRPPRA